MIETLAQFTRRTQKAISSLKNSANLPLDFKARSDAIASEGFPQMDEKEMVELFTGYSPNRKRVARSCKRGIYIPLRHKFEWVYDHRTNRVEEGTDCTWTTSPTNYWHETTTPTPWSYFTGGYILEIRADVIVGGLDYLKTAIPDTLKNNLRTLKDLRIFNSFEVLASSRSWQDATTNPTGILIGNLWDIVNDKGKLKIKNQKRFFADRW